MSNKHFRDKWTSILSENLNGQVYPHQLKTQLTKRKKYHVLISYLRPHSTQGLDHSQSAKGNIVLGVAACEINKIKSKKLQKVPDKP
jgi:hypothetical protein